MIRYFKFYLTPMITYTTFPKSFYSCHRIINDVRGHHRLTLAYPKLKLIALAWPM